MQTTAHTAALKHGLSFNDLLMFQTLPLDVLVAAVTGKVDIVQLAREELASRGLDHKGKWVGFDRAEAIARLA